MKPSQCLECGTPIQQPAKGRRLYCADCATMRDRESSRLSRARRVEQVIASTLERQRPRRLPLLQRIFPFLRRAV